MMALNANQTRSKMYATENRAEVTLPYGHNISLAAWFTLCKYNASQVHNKSYAHGKLYGKHITTCSILHDFIAFTPVG
jgi:hypothetical protein